MPRYHYVKSTGTPNARVTLLDRQQKPAVVYTTATGSTTLTTPYTDADGIIDFWAEPASVVVVATGPDNARSVFDTLVVPSDDVAGVDLGAIQGLIDDALTGVAGVPPNGNDGQILSVASGDPAWVDPGSVVSSGVSQPTIVATASAYGSVAATGNKGSVVLPAGIEPGDMILIFMGTDFPPSAIDSGFVIGLPKTDNFVNGTYAVKSADGTEDGATVTVTMTGSQAWTLYAVVLRGVKYLGEANSPIRNTGGTTISTTLSGGPSTVLDLIFGLSHQNAPCTLNVGTSVLSRIDAAHCSGLWKFTPGKIIQTFTVGPGSSNGNVIVALAVSG